MAKTKQIKPDPTKTLYIAWKVAQMEFVKWRYVGGGVTEPVMKEVIIEKRARWGAATAEAIRAAKAYIESDRPDGYLVIKEV